MPYNCPKCERVYVSRTNLTRHLHTHTEAQKLSCEHCLFTCHSKQELNCHIIGNHNMENNYHWLHPEYKKNI